MKCLRPLRPLFLALAFAGPAFGAGDVFRAPDTITLKDGAKLRGLIIRNTAFDVILQQEFTEKTIAKSDILRIDDHPDEHYTDVPRKGDLPSWRVMANDLRTNDIVRTLIEIPATMIDAGEFRHVPYKSFRVNRDVELNIYGDPNDPAGVELGIYGMSSGNKRLRKTLRGYLAGFLTSRAQVGALYSLDLDGGIAEADGVTLEITPKDAPDAEGAWWVSIYKKDALADVRLDREDYARITRPMDEVTDRRGRLLQKWTAQEAAMSERMENADEDTMVLLRGFYRDENGDFRVITGSPSTN